MLHKVFLTFKSVEAAPRSEIERKLLKSNILLRLGYLYSEVLVTCVANLTHSSATNSSASFDKNGIREMGRKGLLTPYSFFCFGTGIVSSPIQDGDGSLNTCDRSNSNPNSSRNNCHHSLLVYFFLAIHQLFCID